MKELVDFIICQGNGVYSEVSRENLNNIIKKHIEYRTILVTRDEKGITSLARWNWDGPNTMFICDVVVREDKRGTNTLKDMIRRGQKKHPNFKYLRFERLGKYPGRERRLYSVSKFLGGTK